MIRYIYALCMMNDKCLNTLQEVKENFLLDLTLFHVRLCSPEYQP